jgi:aldehyde dehydrogenase (NAD+)
MSAQSFPHDPASQRQYFQTGATRSYAFRRQQLQGLYDAIVNQEAAIHAALYTDLGKGGEEAYATETGLVLAEIRHMLKHLSRWMRPRKVRTNLLNQPGSSLIYPDPLGVVLVVSPWNYPFQLSMVPLAAAIAAGNAVVLKPSELAPATVAMIAQLVAGLFPAELVSVVQGDGAVVVPELIRSFRFDHIFFTGSVGVGRSIYQLAAAQLVPVTLELGGKSPVVVTEDADLRVAARRIIVGKFINAGQTCIAPDYLLVHASVRDTLVECMREAIIQFYGAEPSTSEDYGRIINTKRFDTLVSYLSGSGVIHGGDHNRASLYIAPTLLEAPSPDAPLMQDEIFGPLLPVLTYNTREEALAIIRRHPDPLAFYLFAKSRQEQQRWIEAIPFGGGCINNTDWHFTNPYLPFGGIGNSGVGAYHGKHSFDAFTHAKPLLRSYTFIDPAIKYPPFKGKMKWLKFFIR